MLECAHEYRRIIFYIVYTRKYNVINLDIQVEAGRPKRLSLLGGHLFFESDDRFSKVKVR